jgi:hypothetical protein
MAHIPSFIPALTLSKIKKTGENKKETDKTLALSSGIWGSKHAISFSWSLAGR